MANPVIQIRRSAVSGRIPSTTQLSAGEFAINTYDGKIFIKQDQGGVGVGTTIIVVNPWSVGTGTNTYNTYFTSGSVGIGTTNPTEALSVLGKIQINQNNTSDNRLIFRGQPGSSYRWNIDNYGSANDFRIFREDDATTANGAVYLSISTTGTLTATKFSGDGSLLTGIAAGSSGVVVQNQGSPVGTAGTLNFSTNLTASFSSGTATISLSNNPSITGILTADQVYTSNNGNGTNIRIGDDFWVGDINVANTIRFSGAQDSTQAFVVFGSSDAVALGRTGTGALYYGGDFTVSGVSTSTTINSTNLVSTRINSSGVSTLTTLLTTNLQPTNINATGISTLTNARGTNLNFSGISTISTLYVSSGEIDNFYTDVGIATVIRGSNLNYTGVSTLTNARGTNLNFTGVSTLTNATGTNINFSGVGTITTLNTTNLVSTRINSSGVSTLTTLLTTNLQPTNINASGISTLTNARGTNLNFSGVSTISTLYVTSGEIDNFYTDVGIATVIRGTNLNYSGIGTITTLSVTNLVPTNINSSGVNTLTTLNSTIATLTNASGTNLNFSGISTLGTIRISSGIVTATSGVVTYYGDGSKLTGIVVNANATVAIGTTAPSSPSAGDMWYNSNIGRTFIYYNDGDSSQWVDSAPFRIPVQSTLVPGRSDTNFTATAGQTTFSVSYTVGYIDVYLNGVRLTGTEYVANNGTSVILAEGAAAGDIISVVELRTGIGATGATGPEATKSLTIGTRAGAYTQNAVGTGITIALRSGIGTASF